MSIFRSEKTPEYFSFLIGNKIKDIMLFEEGTEEDKDNGRIILPRFYFIFEGSRNGELQFKPFGFNQYRIVVYTYQDIIIKIESIG